MPGWERYRAVRLGPGLGAQPGPGVQSRIGAQSRIAVGTHSFTHEVPRGQAKALSPGAWAGWECGLPFIWSLALRYPCSKKGTTIHKPRSTAHTQHTWMTAFSPPPPGKPSITNLPPVHPAHYPQDQPFESTSKCSHGDHVSFLLRPPL